jgi:hypothetical protein
MSIGLDRERSCVRAALLESYRWGGRHCIHGYTLQALLAGLLEREIRDPGLGPEWPTVPE